MKKFFVCFLLSIYAVCGYAEDLTTLVELQTPEIEFSSSADFDYRLTAEWGKYKVLRTIGWSALGYGVPAVFAGSAITLHNALNHGSKSIGILGGALVLSGALCAVSSIPILICGYRFRYKAKQMSLKFSPTVISSYCSLSQMGMPSFGVILQL